MKFKVSVSSSGFNTDAIMKNLTGKAFDHRLDAARKKVQDLRCPEHGSGVMVSIDGAGSKRTLTVTGCCDVFRKQAMALIRQK